MASDASATTLTTAMAGLVAGLCVSVSVGAAVYALKSRVDIHTRARADTHSRAETRTQTRASTGKARGAGEEGVGGASDVRRRRRKGKGKAEGTGESGSKDKAEDKDVAEDNHKGEDKGKGRVKDGGAVATVSVPGAFDDAGAEVGSVEGSPAGTAIVPNQETSIKTQKKKKKAKKAKKQKQEQDKDRDDEEDQETGSETGKEAMVGPTVAHRPRSGDSTDTSVSLSPSEALQGFSRGMGKGSFLAPQSQPHALRREIRPSLSLDTDSSWTRVDRRRLKTSKSTDGLPRRIADTMDVTSSDLASTASDSPVAERMDGIKKDMGGARADLAQRTLAEKLVPKPSKSGVEDMLEQPDVPTLARVIRVQPPADETPVPGFSWEDYGDVVEESTLVHDADEEDEGEWGVVKSRNRTRPSQATTAPADTSASASTSTSNATVEPAGTTKKQRQNARKRELVKSAKAEVEATRLQGLAKHKRELERLRIIEQSRQGSGKQPGGGMQAVVDDRGKLVWE